MNLRCLLKYTIRLIVGLALASAIGLSLLTLHMLLVLDWSEQPPSPTAAQRKDPDFYLISYADGAEIYFQNRSILAASAVNRGFDTIINYHAGHLATEFVQQHPVLQAKTGAGYWLWKPYLILKTLRQMPEGAVLVYLDSGAIIRQPLRQFINDGLTAKDILLFAYLPYETNTAGAYANNDVFKAIECTSAHCYQGHHVWAGFIALRNSKASRNFIAQWLKYCQQTEVLQGINLQTPNTYPDFAQHQHDEGILSALAARESAQINFVPVDKAFFQYIKVHRRRDASDSLLGNISSKFIHLERRLLNWWWVKQLRACLE
jgi:hypothetical protein